MQSDIQQAVDILNTNSYFTLGTAGADHKPWTSPLFFARDKAFNFYWISPKDSKHSQNLAENENVSLVCFNSTAPK